MVSIKKIISLSAVFAAVFMTFGKIQATSRSLDTGQTFTQIYDQDHGLFLNNPFYDISNVSKTLNVGDKGTLSGVKILPVYGLTPSGTLSFYQDVAPNNLIGAAAGNNSTGDIQLKPDGSYNAVKAGTVKVALNYTFSSSFKSELLNKYPNAFVNNAPANYSSANYMYDKYGNQTFYITVKDSGLSLYRLYNPNSGEHFYTLSSYERDSLVKSGWNYEGIAETTAPKNSTPVYRVYNPNAGDHLYTIGYTEVQNLVSHGWKYEGIAFYSAPSTTGTPLYRLYNPNAKTGAHLYTESSYERDSLVKAGWKYEGISWYGLAN